MTTRSTWISAKSSSRIAALIRWSPSTGSIQKNLTTEMTVNAATVNQSSARLRSQTNSDQRHAVGDRHDLVRERHEPEHGHRRRRRRRRRSTASHSGGLRGRTRRVARAWRSSAASRLPVPAVDARADAARAAAARRAAGRSALPTHEQPAGPQHRRPAPATAARRRRAAGTSPGCGRGPGPTAPAPARPARRHVRQRDVAAQRTSCAPRSRQPRRVGRDRARGTVARVRRCGRSKNRARQSATTRSAAASNARRGAGDGVGAAVGAEQLAAVAGRRAPPAASRRSTAPRPSEHPALHTRSRAGGRRANSDGSSRSRQAKTGGVAEELRDADQQRVERDRHELRVAAQEPRGPRSMSRRAARAGTRAAAAAARSGGSAARVSPAGEQPGEERVVLVGGAPGRTCARRSTARRRRAAARRAASARRGSTAAARCRGGEHDVPVPVARCDCGVRQTGQPQKPEVRALRARPAARPSADAVASARTA